MVMKLKECPFCGGDATLFRKDCAHYIVCADCRARTNGYDTPNEAIRAWKNRIAYTTDEWCTDCKRYDIETILNLLSHANMESIQLRKMTTTSFRVEIVFSINYLMDGGEE